MKYTSVVILRLRDGHAQLVIAVVCRVEVIDFGSSCYETDQLYVYVQSRFYRAPEVRRESSLCKHFSTQLVLSILGRITLRRALHHSQSVK